MPRLMVVQFPERRAKLKIARIPIAAALALALFAAPVPAAVAPSKPPATDAPAPAPPTPDEAKPADTLASPADRPASAPATAAPKRSGTDIGDWFAAWIADSGMPVWAWALLAMAAFLLLRGLFRGADDRRDLIGPPSSLRLGARTVAPRPRRPDPPQRL